MSKCSLQAEQLLFGYPGFKALTEQKNQVNIQEMPDDLRQEYERKYNMRHW